MSVLLWIGQVFFGLYFVAVGVAHFVVPAGMPDQMAWFYDLSPTLHAMAGTVEILGGLGLLVPILLRRWAALVPLAAAGLALVMLGATVWHLPRGEVLQAGLTVGNALVLGLLAYGRWRVRPLS